MRHNICLIICLVNYAIFIRQIVRQVICLIIYKANLGTNQLFHVLSPISNLRDPTDNFKPFHTSILSISGVFHS